MSARCEVSCEDSCEVCGEDLSEVGGRHLGDRRRRDLQRRSPIPSLTWGGDVLVTLANLAASAGDVLVTAGGEDRGESVV